MKKKYILRKKIFAVIFFIMLFSFSGVNCISQRKEVQKALTEELSKVHAWQIPETSNIEDEITEELAGKMYFIETYSALTEVLNKKEICNYRYIKDETGTLQYSSFYREDDDNIPEYAMRVRRMADAVKAQDTKVLMVSAPAKYLEGKTPLRKGLPANDTTAAVNELLYYMNLYGIKTLDLREYFPNDELTLSQTFFRSDHHWTIPAAYYATRILVEKLFSEFGENLDPTGYYTGRISYTPKTFKNIMLGSTGRNTGAFYVGVENFTALFPNFIGDFRRSSMAADGTEYYTKGNFADALMNIEEVAAEDNIYHVSPYTMYLNELRTYESITNKEKPDAPSILFLRDSYFSPVIVFMAPMCSQIDAIYIMEETDKIDIEDFIVKNHFDYIIVEVNPYNIGEESFNFFYD